MPKVTFVFLEDLSEAQSNAPATSIVLNGATIIQMLKPVAAKNFEYASLIFIAYLSTKLQGASRLDQVWDTYTEDSLKGKARAKRGKGVRRCFLAAAAIPENCQSFLCMDGNKTELFRFLSQAALKWFDEEDKQLVITNERGSSQ